MAKSNQAICADCGTKFELPFTPTSDKPVYCNDCFKNKRRQGRRDDRGRQDNRRRQRQMFSAVCDKCGNKCEVPFRPTKGKPIYCDNCFGRTSDRSGSSRDGDKIQELNNKLDTIINALVTAKIIKLPKETKKPKEAKGSIKPKQTPAPKKKVAPKKKSAPKKKATLKKKK